MQSVVQRVSCLGMPPARPASQICQWASWRALPENRMREPSKETEGSAEATKPAATGRRMSAEATTTAAPCAKRSLPCIQADGSYCGVEVNTYCGGAGGSPPAAQASAAAAAAARRSQTLKSVD